MNIFDRSKELISKAFHNQQQPITGQLQVTLVEARGLNSKDFLSRSDPYVILSMNGIRHKSRVIKNNANPRWMETFTFGVSNPNIDIIRLEVVDRDFFTPDDVIGYADLPIGGLQRGVPRDEWVPLRGHQNSQIHVTLTALDFGMPPGAMGGMYQQQMPMQGNMGMYPQQMGYPQQPMMQQPMMGGYPNQMMQQPMMQQPMMGGYQQPMGYGYPQYPNTPY
jgi:hypothetical protein